MKTVTVLRFLCVILFILFALPLFTGFVFNPGNAAGMGGSALLYYFLTEKPVLPKPAAVCLGILAGICLVTAAVLSFLMINASLKKPDGETTLIILGCEVQKERPSLMLERRLQRGLEYLEEHPQTPAVLSGGQGSDEDISEAEAMYRWLTAHGIDESRLYKEDRSTSTAENMRYSAAVIRDAGLPVQTVVVTDGFHLYRAEGMAAQNGLEPYGLAARTPWWLVPTFWVREWFAIIMNAIYR